MGDQEMVKHLPDIVEKLRTPRRIKEFVSRVKGAS
jgi:hypothetical protein